MAAILAFDKNRHNLTVFFTLSLNFKQMNLYRVAFFLHIVVVQLLGRKREQYAKERVQFVLEPP